MSYSIFDYTRAWFNYAFDNPDKVKPIHHAVYYYALEHCNRLGWKEKFGLPTGLAMEATGIKSYNTFKKALDGLEAMGFFLVIIRSQNQYQANVIALSKNDTARDRSLDKSIINHSSNHCYINEQISDSIIIPYTSRPLDQKPYTVFRPPSIEEVYQLMIEKKLKKEQAEIESEGFVSYYDSIGWKVGKDKNMVNWKSAVTGWINRMKEFNSSNKNNSPKNSHENVKNDNPEGRKIGRTSEEAFNNLSNSEGFTVDREEIL